MERGKQVAYEGELGNSAWAFATNVINAIQLLSIEMPFCRNCGQELPPSAAFCPRCGSSVSTASGFASNTQFDRITKESGVQDLWFRRLIAFVIDSIIVGILAFIVALVIYVIVGVTTAAFYGIYFGSGFAFAPFTLASAGIAFLAALFYIIYFTFSEASYGRTFGKNLMSLAVITTDGSKLDVGKAFVRNVSKIYWVLLLLDLIGGFFMSNLAAGQKFSDHVANTNVVHSRRPV